MNMPAIILKILELVKNKFPRKDVVDPRIMKIAEKPKVKKIVLITTKLFFFSISFSKDVPEIYEI